MTPRINSNPVALIIPSEGMPSIKMLKVLPMASERNSMKAEIVADFLNEF